MVYDIDADSNNPKQKQRSLFTKVAFCSKLMMSKSTVGGLICPLAPFAPFFEVAVFVCTVNGAVRFGRLRFNGEDEELGQKNWKMARASFIQ